MSIKEYLNEIKSHLIDYIDTIIDLKSENLFKMATNFTSSKDSDKIRTIYTKSNNREIMTSNKIAEIIEKLFDSLLQRYQRPRRINGRHRICF